jgi:hypothetical protein
MANKNIPTIQTIRGNVGIGTTSPKDTLAVNGTIAKYTTTGYDGAFDNFIKYGFKSDLEGTGQNLDRWIGADATITAGAAAANKLKFKVYSGGASGSPIDVMTLDGAGNVGIGTTSPGTKLHVSSSENANWTTTFQNTLNSNSHTVYTAYNNNSNNTRYGVYISGAGITSADYHLLVNDQFAVVGSGLVGIGTANPVFKLDVHSLGSGIRHYGNSTNKLETFCFGGYQTIIATNGSVTNEFGYAAGNFYVQTADTEKFRITSSGNVGIGTDSPDYPLHVVRNIASADVGLFVGNQRAYGLGDFSGGALYLGKEESGGNQVMGAVIGRPESQDNSTIGALIFQTRTSGAPTEKMRISSSGTVGIGTTSPGATFHVNGTGLFSDNTTINAEGKYFQTSGAFGWGGSTTVGVRMGTDNTAGLIDFRRWLGSGTLHHVAAVRQVLGGSNRYGLGFLANDLSTNSLATTVRMYIDPNSGNVGIGTTSPVYKLQLSTNSAAKPTSNVWTVVSDSRVKENVRTYDSGLDKVLQIEPKLFDYNGKAGFEKTKDNVGIIAQEIKKILPETVNTYKAKLNEGDEEETELYSYDGHALTFALVNSIKELNKKIEQLETRIQTLENKQL